MIWEEITVFSLFLGELNKEIEAGLLSSSRFLAQSVTFDHSLDATTAQLFIFQWS